MKKLMLEVLNKTYDNPILRRTTQPLFLGNPGGGKSTIINEFVKSKGVNCLTTILSQRMANEVAGGMMPNSETRMWEMYDSFELRNLKDGDVWFIDEVFNGTLKSTLDAVLNLLQGRVLPSGVKLADIMIVGASNPQGLIHLTPQIKERFTMYDVKFESSEFQEYLKNKYGMAENISVNICNLINKEKFEVNQWNYHSPRSIEKALNAIGVDLKSPYDDILMPFLNTKINCPMDINVDIHPPVKKDEEIEYLKVLKAIIPRMNELEGGAPVAKVKKIRKPRPKKVAKSESVKEEVLN